MKFAWALIFFSVAALALLAALSGCAATPTTQQSQILTTISENAVVVGYDGARLELYALWSENKISPSTWTGQVVPAMNAAAAAVQTYEANPTNAGLQQAAQAAIVLLADYYESFLLQSSPTASTPPQPLPPALPIPVLTTQP